MVHTSLVGTHGSVRDCELVIAITSSPTVPVTDVHNSGQMG